MGVVLLTLVFADREKKEYSQRHLRSCFKFIPRLGLNMAGTYLFAMIILFLNKFKTTSYSSPAVPRSIEGCFAAQDIGEVSRSDGGVRKYRQWRGQIQVSSPSAHRR